MSRPTTAIDGEYDVVVVGSGYGGGIAAARLAASGAKVCVLERGRELHPGDYPTSPVNALPFVQARTPLGHFGARNALFDFRMHSDMSVLVGSGLGGTSLINAGVALRPRDHIFDDPRWPAALRVPGVLDDGFRKAEAMLGSTPVPAKDPLAKVDALDRAGRALDRGATRPKINVTFSPKTNYAGIDQAGCTLCGDCVTGCNVGAKNTVLMNYLPHAFKHGAHIFTEIEVLTVNRVDDHWIVRFRDANVGGLAATATRFVCARVVVLAAGTLGTTEILLRSRDQGLLKLSDKVGEHFSGNGDVIAFAYDTDQLVHGIGVPYPPDGRAAPGPCIAGLVDLRDDSRRGGFIIEDGVVPSLLRGFMPLGFALGAVAAGPGNRSIASWFAHLAREFTGALAGPFAGPTDRTLMFLLMSGDDDRGKIVFTEDHTEVRWPHVGEQPPFRRNNNHLRTGSDALAGTFLPDPIWTAPFGHSVMTVHPLGGCVMADDAKNGVVSDRGKVFAGTTGTATHEGLYVADGSIVPRPLAANPSLTISALAERLCTLLIKEWSSQWSLVPTS
jgi:cholesterol oxidase